MRFVNESSLQGKMLSILKEIYPADISNLIHEYLSPFNYKLYNSISAAKMTEALIYQYKPSQLYDLIVEKMKRFDLLPTLNQYELLELQAYKESIDKNDTVNNMDTYLCISTLISLYNKYLDRIVLMKDKTIDTLIVYYVK